MDGVAISIIGRPRPLPRPRHAQPRPQHLHPQIAKSPFRYFAFLLMLIQMILIQKRSKKICGKVFLNKTIIK